MQSITFSTFTNAFDNKPQRRSMALPDFFNHVLGPHQPGPVPDGKDPKTGLPAISGSLYAPGALRRGIAVDALSLICFDFDNAIEEPTGEFHEHDGKPTNRPKTRKVCIDKPARMEDVREVMDDWGGAYAMYPTFSHTNEWPRFRVVIPLLESVAPEIWSQVTEYAIRHLKLEAFRAAIDVPALNDVARIFFLSPHTDGACAVEGNLLEIPLEEMAQIEVPLIELAPWQQEIKASRKATSRTWIPDCPRDLVHIDIVAAMEAKGLEVGCPRPNGDGIKHRAHCPWASEHSHGADDDSFCLFLKEGKLPHVLCSHSGHAHLGFRDLIEFLGIKVVEDHAPAAEPFPRVGGGRIVRRDTGLWLVASNGDEAELHMCGPLRVMAETRDANGEEWGVQVEWTDHDNRVHRVALPRKMFAGDGLECRSLLLRGGLFVPSNRKAREALMEFFTKVKSPERCLAVTKIGWHNDAFVLPEETIGATGREGIALQNTRASGHAFHVKGDLGAWRQGIGRFCPGNSRLVLAVSCAFAAPLLSPLGSEAGGFNVRGPSSIGKTTILQASGSVCGGSELPAGYIETWRATSNGLEAVAYMHNDSLLCLDEMGQVDASEAGEVAYLLANGQVKVRSKSEGGLRPRESWRLLFLSTGEIGLTEKMQEAGKRPKTGQSLRLVDIPATPKNGFGIFENLHGFPNGQALADHLKAAARETYGTPLRAFLERLTAKEDHYRDAVRNQIEAFVKQHCSAGADGQVRRVAHRFGLVAAAGELAIEFGILPWPKGESLLGAGACFASWLDERGGSGADEVKQGVAQVLHFLEVNGSARFEDLNDDKKPRITNRSGFKTRTSTGVTYYMFPKTFKDEACQGFDSRLIAKTLLDLGRILGDGEKTSRPCHIGGLGAKRYYVFPPETVKN